MDLMAGLALAEALAARAAGRAARRGDRRRGAATGAGRRADARERRPTRATASPARRGARGEQDVEIEQPMARGLGDRRRLIGGARRVRAPDRRDLHRASRSWSASHDAFSKLGDANWYWIVVAVGFNVVAFVAYARSSAACSAGARTRTRSTAARLCGVVPDHDGRRWRPRPLLGRGRGGIILTYWALRKAGMERRRAACRMVAFLVLLYSVYALSLIVFGILLRTGVLNGDAPDRRARSCRRRSPAFCSCSFILIALIPGDFERRIIGAERRQGRAGRIATPPGDGARARSSTGVRTAFDRLRDPRTGLAGRAWRRAGYWAGNIGVLWARFHAYGGERPVRRRGAGLLRRAWLRT